MKSGLVSWARTSTGSARPPRAGRTTPCALTWPRTPSCSAASPPSAELGSFSRLTLARRDLRTRPGGQRDRPDPLGAGRMGLPARPRRRPASADGRLARCSSSTAALTWRTLSTGLFERVRRERLLPAAPGATRCTRCNGPWRTWGSAVRRSPPAAIRRTARASGGAQDVGRSGRTAGTARPRSRPGSAALSAPPCSRSGDGWQAEHPEAADPGRLDAADLRGLDRRAGPDAGRRLRPAHRRAEGPRRQAAGSSDEGDPAQRGADLLPGLPGMGMDAPGASTRSARWPPRAASPPCSARTHA